MTKIMTPKEKAKELMQKAYDLDQHNKTTQSRCKQIALLCVDVILNDVGAKDWELDTATKTNYWRDVETELSLL